MDRVGVAVAVLALMAAGQAHTGEGGRAKRHLVARGDTLSMLANRFGVSTAALVRANSIDRPDHIRVGQVLVIPSGGTAEVARAVPAASSSSVAPVPPPLPSPVVIVGDDSTRYTVAQGDALGLIARRYGTTVGELARANDLTDPDRIREGLELTVPGPGWLCPVQGPVRFANDWGAPRDGGRRHLGTDVFAPRGTPVVASVSGTVEHSPGARAGLAYYLRGDDGNTYYGAHLDALEPPGPVTRGQIIGAVGTTGNASATAPHLHFGLEPGGGDPVNPYFTLGRWCL